MRIICVESCSVCPYLESSITGACGMEEGRITEDLSTVPEWCLLEKLPEGKTMAHQLLLLRNENVQELRETLVKTQKDYERMFTELKNAKAYITAHC